MKSQSHRIQILEKHINQWKGKGVTNLLIGQLVVESVYRLGLNELLESENVLFATSGDTEKCMRTNSQNIQRWLGYADSGMHEDYRKIYLLEQAIVAAMPDDIRQSYLYEVYCDSAVGFSLNSIDISCSRLDNKKTAQSLIKEQSEAVSALLDLPEKPTRKQVKTASRELSEAIATAENVRRQLNEKYPDCVSGD